MPPPDVPAPKPGESAAELYRPDIQPVPASIMTAAYEHAEAFGYTKGTPQFNDFVRAYVAERERRLLEVSDADAEPKR